MSITSSSPDEQGIVHTAAGRHCFLCEGPLQDPSVYWMGATAEIALHAECVLDLALRLFRDVHEIRNPAYYARRRAQ
jgi:hypothetical protein